MRPSWTRSCRSRRPVKSALKRAGFVLVTSQEIDALCEGDNIPLARRTMDEMLHQAPAALSACSRTWE